MSVPVLAAPAPLGDGSDPKFCIGCELYGGPGDLNHISRASVITLTGADPVDWFVWVSRTDQAGLPGTPLVTAGPATVWDCQYMTPAEARQYAALLTAAADLCDREKSR